MKLTREQFNSYESGKIIAGLQWEIQTELGLEKHETYQFDSLEDLEKCIAFFQTVPGMQSIKAVTHKGQYRNMKTVATWRAS